jgi:DNA invertase Pin-like site-specific DNA recombinase
VASEYRNTLRAHAHQLSALAKAYTHLAARHRVAASASERGRQRITFDGYFNDWIFQACEFSAAAERLLALEIELARSFGVTWDEVASALGVSRQAAWDRFANQARWQKTRRVSQLRAARRAELLRDLRSQIGGSEEDLLALQEWLGRRPKAK